jgi:hypothetical protein
VADFVEDSLWRVLVEAWEVEAWEVEVVETDSVVVALGPVPGPMGRNNRTKRTTRASAISDPARKFLLLKSLLLPRSRA